MSDSSKYRVIIITLASILGVVFFFFSVGLGYWIYVKINNKLESILIYYVNFYYSKFKRLINKCFYFYKDLRLDSLEKQSGTLALDNF